MHIALCVNQSLTVLQRLSQSKQSTAGSNMWGLKLASGLSAHCCLPWAMCVCYLSQGAYNGTFHDAAQEEQVDVFGSGRGGQLTHIIQHLLHGWTDGTRHKDPEKQRQREKTS